MLAEYEEPPFLSLATADLQYPARFVAETHAVRGPATRAEMGVALKSPWASSILRGQESNREECVGKRKSIPVALEYLRSEEPTLRSGALNYLLGMEEKRSDARVVSALVRALDDPDDKFRSTVVFLLGILGARYDLLLAHLKNDASAAVRYKCLRHIWPDNPRAPEAYRAALEDSDDGVLLEACVKIGLMRRNIPDAWRDEIVPALRRLLEHSSGSVRYEACESLHKIRAVGQRVVTILEELHRQPEAVDFNNRIRWNRGWNPARREYPPWHFTTEELLQAARNALSG
jgi:hypothetical protein